MTSSEAARSAAAGPGGGDGRDGLPFGQRRETRADGPDARNSAGAMHAAIGRAGSGAKILGDGEGDNSELPGFPAGPAGAVTAKMTAADEVGCV